MAQFRTFAPAAAEVAHDPIFAREAPYTRIDGAAIAAVTNLYREVLPAGGAILDVMSGWVPHLAPEAPYRRVVGIGIERRALAENPFLDEWRVQDLNSTSVSAVCRVRVRRRDDLRRNPIPGAAGRGVARHRPRAAARRAADRHVFEPVRRDQGDRVLVPARRNGTAVSCGAAFCRGRELGRHTLPRPYPAGRRPAALCRDRAQPRRRSARTERLTGRNRSRAENRADGRGSQRQDQGTRLSYLA